MNGNHEPEVEEGDDLDGVQPTPWYEEVAVSWLFDYYHRRHSISTSIPLAIDVACGSGFLSAELARLCQRVIGIDISRNAIEAAEENNKLPDKVEFRIGDAQQLSSVCTERADIIVVRMAIVGFNNEDFFSEVRRLLKPGGVFGIFGYKAVGIQIEGGEQIDFLMEQFPHEPMDTISDNLKADYDDRHVPFQNIERRSYRLPIQMIKNRIRKMCEDQGSEAAKEKIEDILRNLPRATSGLYEINFDAFGFLTHV